MFALWCAFVFLFCVRSFFLSSFFGSDATWFAHEILLVLHDNSYKRTSSASVTGNDLKVLFVLGERFFLDLAKKILECCWFVGVCVWV